MWDGGFDGGSGLCSLAPLHDLRGMQNILGREQLKSDSALLIIWAVRAAFFFFFHGGVFVPPKVYETGRPSRVHAKIDDCLL